MYFATIHHDPVLKHFHSLPKFLFSQSPLLLWAPSLGFLLGPSPGQQSMNTDTVPQTSEIMWRPPSFSPLSLPFLLGFLATDNKWAVILRVKCLPRYILCLWSMSSSPSSLLPFWCKASCISCGVQWGRYLGTGCISPLTQQTSRGASGNII